MVPNIRRVAFHIQADIIDADVIDGDTTGEIVGNNSNVNMMPTIGLASGGNYISNISRNSPLLNKKIQVQVIARDASAADKIAYELKRAGAEVIGIAQKAGKVVMDVSAVATAGLVTLLLANHLIEGVKPANEAAKKSLVDFIQKVKAKNPGLLKKAKWATILIGGGLVGKYIYDRVKSYREPPRITQNNSSFAMGSGYNNNRVQFHSRNTNRF